MLKKTFTFTDYDGNERTEEHHFNLTKAELMEMQLSKSGGLVNMINRIVSAQDAPKIVEVFKDLILRSYGVKSDDGRRIIKSKELSDEFAQTEAYSQLFVELATNPEAASAFINGIIPADMAKELANSNGPALVQK